ncbi:MAG: hypothetical protein K2W91_10640 [Novosphingobium sp.]|nr:hypothetical protein [Novosphingobium sp.]
MEERFTLPIEFRRSRLIDLGWALICLLVVGFSVWALPQATEQDLLNTHVRRGGWLKLLILEVGVEWFVLAFGLGAVGLGILGAGFLWRAIDSRPDILVTDAGFSFHPARFGRFVEWEDIDRWTIAIDGETKYLKIHIREWYWRPLGIYPRKTISIREEPHVLAKIMTVLQLANRPFDHTS